MVTSTGRSAGDRTEQSGIVAARPEGGPVSTGLAAPPVPVTTAADNRTGDISPQTSDFADRLSTEMVRLVSSATREIVLQLHPPALGDVAVRVAVSGQDVAAWFGASETQVQQAIGQALGQLGASLSSAGYNLSGAWVGGDGSFPREPHANSVPTRRAPALAGPTEIAAARASEPARLGVSVYA